VAPVSKITLLDGRRIPQVGLGTWPLGDREVERAVEAALAAGYRHFDTAVRYGNERGVGRGIRLSGVPRPDVWVTTKLDGDYQGRGMAFDGLHGSLERLGLDYVDLVLVHWPLPWRAQYVATWETFIELQGAGLARSIGVSNFKPEHIDRIVDETGIVPTVNQIELNPAVPRFAQRAHAAASRIHVQAWRPLGGPDGALLSSAVVAQIASKHGRSPAQVVLRWHVQQGLCVVPRTSNPARLAENLDVYGFDLDEEDMAELARLDAGPEAGVDSDVTGH
jgi:2,5-diketo-D-gluconate reductase A